MFLEKIKTPGIAHLSYIVGDGDVAVVIDPRRDIELYCKIASNEGVRIEHIFETHRNEDFVVGSIELAQRTGATIHHGAELPFEYGETVEEGDEFFAGDLKFRVLKTPGHTMESISLAVWDQNTGEQAVGVFTGDALFVNEVGRTDFYPDRAEEVAGMLYDSIFDKLLPLGDQTLLWPAHGAGSVCGDGMASREFSTIGYEKLNNPALQEKNREAFVARKTSEQHYKPPYFKRMEEYNLKGAPPRPTMSGDVPLEPEIVASALKNGTVLLDLRSPEAIAGTFIPGSLAIPEHMLPVYGGYLLDYGQDIILIPETHHQLKHALVHLERLGYDSVIGYLKGGLHTWETSGRMYGRIKAVHASELKMRLEIENPPILLDVRKKSEFETARLPGAKHIFLGELPDQLNELPKDRTIITFCGSGQRAIIAASILLKNGFESVEDCLGSMQACMAIGCKTKTEDS